jgi:hypothetical protein
MRNHVEAHIESTYVVSATKQNQADLQRTLVLIKDIAAYDGPQTKRCTGKKAIQGAKGHDETIVVRKTTSECCNHGPDKTCDEDRSSAPGMGERIPEKWRHSQEQSKCAHDVGCFNHANMKEFRQRPHGGRLVMLARISIIYISRRSQLRRL